ncbi:hypothetical protein H1R20_g916, partial [Candolleomyces eurysporus]
MAPLPADTWYISRLPNIIVLTAIRLYTLPPGDTIELELPRILILKNAALQAKVQDADDRTSLELSYTPSGTDIPKSTILTTFFKNRTDSVKLNQTLHPGRSYCLTVIGKNAVDVCGDLPEYDPEASRQRELEISLATTSLIDPAPKNSNTAPTKPKPTPRTSGKAAKAVEEPSLVAKVEKPKKTGGAQGRQTLAKTESTGSVTRARAKSAAKAKPSSDATDGTANEGELGAKRAGSSTEAAAKKRKLETPVEENAAASKQGGVRTKVTV